MRSQISVTFSRNFGSGLWSHPRTRCGRTSPCDRIRCTVVQPMFGTIPRWIASCRTCSMVRVIGTYFSFPPLSTLPVFFLPMGSQAKAMISQRVTELYRGA